MADRRTIINPLLQGCKRVISMAGKTKSVTYVPPVRKPDPGIPDDPQSICFPNGVPVYLFPDRLTEIVRVDLHFDAGINRELLPLQSQFTSLLLPGGTSSMTAAEIDAKFDFYGSFPVFAADREKAVIQLYMLPEFFDSILPMIRDILADPVFPEDEFQMQKEGRLQKYLINRGKVNYISLDYFLEALYGHDHPFGRRILPSHFENITTDHLKRFHSANWVGGLLRIAISGNLNERIIHIAEECFGNTPVSLRNIAAELKLPEDGQGKKIKIDKIEAVQSSIRIGKITISFDHPDFAGLKVVDSILGGYFGSRLMQNLREDKGYTYNVGSYLTSFQNSGIITVATEVGSVHTNDAVAQIYREIDKLSENRVPARELKLVRPNLLGNLARQFDGPFNRVDSFLSVVSPGPGLNYFRRLEEKIKTITSYEIKELARTYYRSDNMHEIIAGNTE
jgi:zinc protease